MSVIIKDMDMPKRCIECPLCKHIHLEDSPLLVYACGKGMRPMYSHETAEGVDEFCKMQKPNWCPLGEIWELNFDEIREALAPVQSADAWIPISEKLPEVRQWVLCQCRAGIMDVLRLTADGRWNKNYPHTEYMSGFVVAWMPLPKPYEVEK